VLEKDSLTIGAALVLLVAAIFMPVVELPRLTYDYIVVFDITQSMDVTDYELNGSPVSRLTFARHAARRALRDLPCGSRVGWGVFAEYRTLLLTAPIEVCQNYNDLLATLDRIDGRMRWGNASEITKGVYWAMRAARDVGGNPKVLFLTDGQEAPPLDSGDVPMFEDLKRGAIGGWLIGAGGDIPRRIPKTDPQGRPSGFWRSNEVIQLDRSAAKGTAGVSHEHLSELREPHLRELAQRVGFEYARLTGPASIANAMRNPRFGERRPAPTDLSWLAATAALALLTVCFRPDFLLRKPRRD
jgi:mxaL protein